MTDYRLEMRELVEELEGQMGSVDFAHDPQASERHEKLRRRAEVLGFIISHPRDFLAHCEATKPRRDKRRKP